VAAGRKIVLVDLDGTLADVKHRLHFIRGPKKNWKQFFKKMSEDPPVDEVVQWVRELAEDHSIVVITGRPEEYRKPTTAWLDKHKVPYEAIHMRKDGDRRPDYIIKQEVLDVLDRSSIALVIDDRPAVCDMWRQSGLKCHQVASDADVESAPE
jgi:phosphoglycolate phosphatase-like HAD superfamily hydrolase